MTSRPFSRRRVLQHFLVVSSTFRVSYIYVYLYVMLSEKKRFFFFIFSIFFNHTFSFTPTAPRIVFFSLLLLSKLPYMCASVCVYVCVCTVFVLLLCHSSLSLYTARLILPIPPLPRIVEEYSHARTHARRDRDSAHRRLRGMTSNTNCVVCVIRSTHNNVSLTCLIFDICPLRDDGFARDSRERTWLIFETNSL